MTTTTSIGKKTGRTLYRPVMTSEEFSQATSEDEGFCVYCGEIASGVEPDAERYECESCESCGVYGFEQLMIMGAVTITE